MNIKTAHAAALLAFVPALLSDLSFSHNEVGSDVVVMHSGILDAPQIDTVSFLGWDEVGVESSGDGDGDSDIDINFDIMDLSDFWPANRSFDFHAGTDISALANSVDPFATSSVSDGITEEAGSDLPYSEFGGGLRGPGASLAPIYVAGGFWPPDQERTDPNNAVEPPGLNVGVDPIIDPIIDSIVDSETSETITIGIGDKTARAGSVPDGGATIALLGVSLAGLAVLRRRCQA